ncbi:phosphopantetheine-binding protein [Micromonospora sp. NPDC023956]|uniref:acyl carrier protein n=1 Tax=Micromonospora sp. NPDC023956 TaxID=3155722 RepID=UPI0033C9DD90
MDFEKINSVVTDIAKGLDIDVTKITESGGGFEDLGVDSLTVMDLISRAEAAFGIELPDSALNSIESVSGLVDYIAEATA